MQVRKFNLKAILGNNSFFRVLLLPLKSIYKWLKLFLGFIINTVISLYCYKTIKVYLSNHFTIGIWNLYKKGVKLPHPVGIVIGINVKLGNNCIIYQNVTIGTKDTENYQEANYPVIGDNVTIYPNSLIIGDITIGDNAVIGAGSVVLSDIPSNKTAVGCPAKVI